MEAKCCRLAACGGLAMPKPSCRAGNASKSLSILLDGSLPVMAGISRWCRLFSKAVIPR